MTIANVDITNSLTYTRLIFNQAVQAWNYIFERNYVIPGVLTINPSVGSSTVTLNVANGLIVGNGSQIYSLSMGALTYGLLKNYSLQNTSVTIVPGTNLTGGGTIQLGGASSITLNVNPINSTVNTRADLALATSAVSSWLASLSYSVARFTTGLIANNFGGTGLTSYANGQLLVGRTEGNYFANAPGQNTGITVTRGRGSLNFAANLIQGANVTFSTSNPLSISRNVIANATTTVFGPSELNDTITAQGITTESATANSLNAVHKLVTLLGPAELGGQQINTAGRLLRTDVYTTPGNFTWTPPSGRLYSFLVVTLVGAGAGGGYATSSNQSNAWSNPPAGSGGAYIRAIIPRSEIVTNGDGADPANSIYLTVGTGGIGNTGAHSTADTLSAFGASGTDTIFGGLTSTLWMARANGGSRFVNGVAGYSGGTTHAGGPIKSEQLISTSSGRWNTNSTEGNLNANGYSIRVSGQSNMLIGNGSGFIPAAPGIRTGTSMAESLGEISKPAIVLNASFTNQASGPNNFTLLSSRPGRSGRVGAFERRTTFNSPFDNTLIVSVDPFGEFDGSGFASRRMRPGNNATVAGEGGASGISIGQCATSGLLSFRQRGGNGGNGMIIIETYST